MELRDHLFTAVGLMSALGSATDLTFIGRWEEPLAASTESTRQGIDLLSAEGSSELDPRLLTAACEVLATNTGPDALLNDAKARIRLQTAELRLIAASTAALEELLHEIEILVAAIQGTSPPQQPASRSSGVPGVSDDEARFGQSAAFSGPARPLGDGMRLGIEAAFAEANSTGGDTGALT